MASHFFTLHFRLRLLKVEIKGDSGNKCSFYRVHTDFAPSASKFSLHNLLLQKHQFPTSFNTLKIINILKVNS